MPPETSTQTTTALPPSPVIVGGPGDGVNSAGGAATTTAPVTTKAPETTGQPKNIIKIGSRTFSSVEDADAYVQQLESSTIEKVIQPAVIPPNAGPTKKMIDGRPIEDVIFTDPEKVVEHIKSEVKAEVAAKQAATDKSKAMWEKFYAQNPDLRNKEMLVKTILNQNIQDWKKLSEEDGMKILAQTSRQELRKMGFSSENIEDLPRTEPATIGASGEPSTTTLVTTTKPAPSLVDQVKAMQASRRKK